jgi:hypothetical protein
MDMRRVPVSLHWEPKVIGRDKLDERRWAYGVEAPFDMAWDPRGLVGTTVVLDNILFDVCGIVPKMPYSPVTAGEFIELLVRRRLPETT